MKVVWTAVAERDLTGLCDYIARDNPSAAARVGERIFSAVLGLTHFPNRGRPGRVEGTRELVLAPLPWIAIYEVKDDAVLVLRIVHGAQDWPPRGEDQGPGNPR